MGEVVAHRDPRAQRAPAGPGGGECGPSREVEELNRQLQRLLRQGWLEATTPALLASAQEEAASDGHGTQLYSSSLR